MGIINLPFDFVDQLILTLIRIGGKKALSSNINEVIKEQFQAFLFFYEEILHTKKA